MKLVSKFFPRLLLAQCYSAPFLRTRHPRAAWGERGGSGRGGVVGDWIEMAAGEGKRVEHGTVERDRLGSEILSSYNNYCCPKMKSISLNDLVQGALGYIG